MLEGLTVNVTVGAGGVGLVQVYVLELHVPLAGQVVVKFHPDPVLLHVST